MNLKDKKREKALRSIPYNTMTASDIRFLEKRGIINGVGPERYGNIVRLLMTWLFGTVKHRKHDVNFWQQNGFHEANEELIDDSYLALSNEYKKICKEKWYKKLYKVPKYYITLPFKAWIISLAYSAVESPAGRKAYNESKKD